MTTFMQYKSLLRVLIKNSFNIGRLTKKGGKKGKIVAAVGIGFALVSLCAYAVMMTVMLAFSMGAQGMTKELLYGLLFAGQMVVLFFGTFAVMSYMYFSKDNTLLASLPINSRALFLAKITMAYISEIFFAALIAVPTLTTAGIVGIINGFGIPWYFFLIEILAVIVIPVVPLLLITLLSMPLMYVISFLKRRAFGNGIVMAILYIAVMAMYFLMIGSFSTMTENEQGQMMLPAATIGAFKGIKNATIFNYPLVEALTGNSPIVNILIYLGGIAVLLGVSVLLASAFYKRAVAILAEGQVSSKKSKKTVEFVESGSVFRTFILKEVRTLTHTPVLFMSTILGLVLCPIIIFFMSYTMSPANEAMPGGNKMFMVGMITYISFLLTSSTNQIAVIGFSREGRNLHVLKSLPISVRTIVNGKMAFASAVTVIGALVIGIVFPIASGIRSPIAIIGLPLVTLIGGLGMNCMGLNNDLKNPNLKWNNVSELTRNNRRIIKPMLVAVGVGLLYMVLGIGLSMQAAVQGELLYLLYYGICLVPVSIISVISYKRLYADPEALFDRIEG